MSRAQLTSTVEQNTGGAVAPYVAGKNKVINGDFGIWQRGTSFSVSTSVIFTADRFYTLCGAGTASRQTFTPGTAPVAGYENQYYWNQVITANSQNYEFGQRVENARTFAGQTTTLSFWARSSVGAQTMNIEPIQQFGTGGSPSSPVGSGGSTWTPNSSWQRFSFTFVMPSVAGKTFGTNNDSYIQLKLGQYTTTATNTSIDIWGVQWESGPVATPFTTATGTLSGELAACQRYYYRNTATDAFSGLASAVAPSTSVWQSQIPLPLQFRTKASAVEYGGTYKLNDGTNTISAATVTLGAGAQSSFYATINGAATGLTQWRPYQLFTDGYIAFSAEL